MSWREFAQSYAARFRREVTRSLTTGPLVLPSGESFLVLVHGHEAGLVVSRRLRPFTKKAWLQWDQVARIAVLPPFLSGELKRHTDAELTLSNGPISPITVPWMDEFEQLVPKSILLTRRARPRP